MTVRLSLQGWILVEIIFILFFLAYFIRNAYQTGLAKVSTFMVRSILEENLPLYAERVTSANTRYSSSSNISLPLNPTLELLIQLVDLVKILISIKYSPPRGTSSCYDIRQPFSMVIMVFHNSTAAREIESNSSSRTRNNTDHQGQSSWPHKSCYLRLNHYLYC